MTSRTNYHHGALRETLLTATLELIEQEGIGAVSLRRVARAAGVSPGAPYHHFPDRAALLTALSNEGFRHLTKTLKKAKVKATATAENPKDAVEALLQAYVNFAQENPAYFHLMFRPELKQSQKTDNEDTPADEAFAVLNETVSTSLVNNTEHTVDKDVLAITLWSLAHGLASLWLDGQLAHHNKNPNTLTEQVAKLATKLTTP